MRKFSFLTLIVIAVLISYAVFFQYGCSETTQPKADSVATLKQLTGEEIVARGSYLVTISGCNDCHSPKKITSMGPGYDSSRLLSGHPASEPLPDIIKIALKPGNWGLLGPDVTSFVGPWGISYAANLTPDTATGIGAWTDEVFIKTMRTGKHLGEEGGRPILPPMPWVGIGKLTDEDLKSMFAYLKSITPISNRVPQPVSPPDVMKMK